MEHDTIESLKSRLETMRDELIVATNSGDTRIADNARHMLLIVDILLYVPEKQV